MLTITQVPTVSKEQGGGRHYGSVLEAEPRNSSALYVIAIRSPAHSISCRGFHLPNSSSDCEARLYAPMEHFISCHQSSWPSGSP